MVSFHLFNQGADDERTSSQQEQNDKHIIVPQKSYSQALWAQTGSIDGKQAITWELMARDADVLHDYQPDYKGALEEGVNVSFDKDALQMPAYTWNATVSDNPEPPNLQRFNIYISADENTKLTENDFQVLAIRHINDDAVQIQSATINVKVVDK